MIGQLKVCFSILLLSLLIGFLSCKKDTKYISAKTPENPYDTIDYGSEPPVDSIDAASFLGLHTYIFSTTCAVPGCHDGSFEPDFRTVESAYNTLVYHSVLKNDASNSFKYRVLPGDANKSWLHERITTTDAVLGRMPLYDTLSKNEINLITEWINNGAKDPFGNSPILPNYQPTFFGMLAFENDTDGIRFDSSRLSIIDPIELPKNSTIEFWIGFVDKKDNGDFVIPTLTYNKYKISNNLYEFSNKPELALNVLPANKPYNGANPFGNPPTLPYYHSFKINTANFPVNQRQYIRFYVQDPEHVDPTEIPSDGSPIYLLTYFSFVVK